MTIHPLPRGFRLTGTLAVLVLALTAALAPARAPAADLTVFAAASLSDALRELAPAFTAATGQAVRYCFGASGTLARQIRQGAPADVLVSADQAHMDELDGAGLLLPGTRRTVLANGLVLIVPAVDGPAVADIRDLEKPAVRRIALGETSLVPAGFYAKAYLTGLGLWTRLAPKLIPLDNVRTVLAAVASGNADAGFVYRTDALVGGRVRVALEIAPSSSLPITYPAAVLKGTLHPDAARLFVAFLGSPQARALFARHGFLPAP